MAARKLTLPALLLTLLVVASSGCGSVSAAASLSDANDVLAEARSREAERFAPYEYTRATAYLDKAKECNGMGQYEAAGDFARESQKAAEKAMQVARLNKEQSLRRERFAPTRKDPPKPSGPTAISPD